MCTGEANPLPEASTPQTPILMHSASVQFGFKPKERLLAVLREEVAVEFLGYDVYNVSSDIIQQAA